MKTEQFPAAMKAAAIILKEIEARIYRHHFSFEEIAEIIDREVPRTNMAELREKIEDLKGTFDGFAWDNGAGSSGWDRAIAAVLALIPENSVLCHPPAITNPDDSEP